MKKNLITLTLTGSLLLTSFIPAFASSASLTDRHEQMEKIMGKVLSISQNQIDKYQEQGIRLGQLIPATIIAQKSKLSVKEVLDLHKSGKTYSQIMQEKNISSAVFHQEMGKLHQQINEERKKAGLKTDKARMCHHKHGGKHHHHKCQKNCSDAQ